MRQAQYVKPTYARTFATKQRYTFHCYYTVTVIICISFKVNRALNTGGDV